MKVPETDIIMCQAKICQGRSCKHFDRCNHKMYRPDKPTPKYRICPDCGYKENPWSAYNCEKCDYPLQF